MTTPTVRRVVRRIAVWLVVALGAVAVGAVLVVVTRSDRPGPDYLAADSGSPTGARAVVRVLGEQGVEVTTADSLRDVREQLDDPESTTLLVFDASLILGPEQRRELLQLADHLVVIEPGQEELDDFAPELEQGSSIIGELDAGCSLTAADRAGRIDASGTGYAVGGDATACYVADDTEEAGLVDTVTDGSRVTVLGASGALINAQVLEEGNAALALNLLGERERLVWYIPTFADVENGEVQTPFELTPPWLTPLIVLLGVVGLAAAFWRGRRVGPLVVENLPVVVRANETMEGRARLYERAGARGHALDSLRVATSARLATRLGLPRSATVVEIGSAAAALTGRDRAAVLDLLQGGEPSGDADLVRRSDELLRLEADVARAIRF